MSVFTKEDHLQFLKDIVEIKTVNDNEIEVARYLKDLLEKHDIKADIDEIKGHDNRANLIASIGEGHPVVAISGHMDVVSEGDPNNWQFPPFELTEQDGFLYGRGTSDMKAGLAALVIAMIEIYQSGALKQGTIKLMATAGEEMQQLGSEQLYKEGYMDDVDALVIAEPSESGIVYAHKGSMDYQIVSRGQAAHSSMPVVGQNAIKPLLDFVRNIDEEYEAIRKELQCEQFDFKHVIERIKGRVGDKVEEEEIERVINGLVINHTIIQGGNQVNSVPDMATTDYNIRTVPEFNNDQVKALFKKHIEQINNEGGQLEEDMYLDLDPVLTTGENRLIALGQQVAAHIFKRDVVATPTVGVTDASNLLRDKDEHFSFLMFGPGTVPHQVNEHVNKETYHQFVDYYIELLTSYLNEV